MAIANNATEKKAALQKQIQELQEKIKLVDAEAIHELKLKLSDARKVVKDLETELLEITGEGNTTESKPKVRRHRRASIADEALRDQLLKVLADRGMNGMNAKQLAENLNQEPIRIRKFIKENPNTLKRVGAGPGTKFFLP